MKREIFFAALIILVGTLFLFRHDLTSITGRQVATRLIITQTVGTHCNFTMKSGWNHVSFPCITLDLAFNDTFKNASNDFVYIKRYDASDPNDPWKSYNPNLPNWTKQDLSAVSRSYGYVVYYENDTQFYLENELGIPTLYNLPKGWNFLGYPRLNDTDINDTFGTLIPNFEYILINNASDIVDPWKEWTWNTSKYPSNQDLLKAMRYFGYWIYMNNSDNLMIT